MILGCTLFFIQNIILIFLDIVILIVPSQVSSIIFLASLWVDIAAGIVFSIGLLKFSKKQKNKDELAFKLGYLMLTWSIIVCIVRVLLSMNTGIPLVTDKNISLILFLIWISTSIFFSLIIYYSIEFFKRYSDSNYLIPKLYVSINIIAILFIGIGYVNGQSALSSISTDLTVGEISPNLFNSMILFFLGALAKTTLIPLLGIATFFSLRTIIEENLLGVSIKHKMKKEKMTYSPKKLIYK
jgi:hypothetical protein